MKRAILLMGMVFALLSCDVDQTANQLEETNIQAQIDQDAQQSIDEMSDSEFITYMETVAINQNAVQNAINPELSDFTPGFDWVQAEAPTTTKNSIGACISEPLFSSDGRNLGSLAIEFLEVEGESKVRYQFQTTQDWFVYAVLMNIDDDCSSIPTYNNGEPDVNSFNIRNCFADGKSKVTYQFADSCFGECSCVAAYSIIYNLDANGDIDECIGVWANGETFNMSPTATTFQYCKADCEF